MYLQVSNIMDYGIFKGKLYSYCANLGKEQAQELRNKYRDTFGEFLETRASHMTYTQIVGGLEFEHHFLQCYSPLHEFFLIVGSFYERTYKKYGYVAF